MVSFPSVPTSQRPCARNCRRPSRWDGRTPGVCTRGAASLSTRGPAQWSRGATTAPGVTLLDSHGGEPGRKGRGVFQRRRLSRARSRTGRIGDRRSPHWPPDRSLLEPGRIRPSAQDTAGPPHRHPYEAMTAFNRAQTHETECQSAPAEDVHDQSLTAWATVERRSNDLGSDHRTDDHGPDLHFQVELRGFEPLTPSMRTRCATGLRYSPWNACQPSKDSGLPVRPATPGPPPAGTVSRLRRGWRRRCTGRRTGRRPAPRCR